MKTARCIDNNTEFSPKAIPALRICCGERFRVHTELCSGPWLTGDDILWKRELESPGNFLCCIELEDAGFGDVLAVKLHSIKPDRRCYTGLEGRGSFPYPADIMGEAYEDDSYVKILPVNEKGFLWQETDFEARAMLGCIGTARPLDAPDKDIPHRCGGNLDAKEVRAGSTVYLPVLTDKALLFLGDAHVRQGDGEITGWGAECRAEVELSVEKLSAAVPTAENAVLAEDDERLIALGFGQGFESAYNNSVRALLDFAALRSGRAKKDVYVRLGLAMDCHVAQSCFPRWPVFSASIEKKYL